MQAVKVIKKPVMIKLKKKDGGVLFIGGFKGVEVADPEKMEAKDLIKWLKKNGFSPLARAIRKAISKSSNTKIEIPI